VTIRPACAEDIPLLEALIARSVRALQPGDYTVDTALIQDGTYLVAETEEGIAGCRAWSRRGRRDSRALNW
jgi:N-acetylglutamate synthase-like GNAT family acetyltransferase